MKRDKELTINEVDNHPNKLLEFHVFDESDNTDWHYSWLKDGDFLTWVAKYIEHEDDCDIEAITYLEIPIKGLVWFVNSLEKKFFKTEAEGGLEAGKFCFSEVVDDEKLSISRMMGHPGYKFLNLDRKHYDPYDNGPQYAEFSDEWLFEMGLFDQLKELVKKITNGQV